MNNGGLRRILWLVLVLLLPACGGGGGSTSVPHSTATGSPVSTTVTNAQGGNRIALRMVLGAVQAATKTKKSAAAQKRRPDFSKAKGYARAMQIDAAKRARTTKSATAKRRTASASTRSPLYINEAATDTINVYVNGGSATAYDVSVNNTAQLGVTQLSTQPCQFLSDGGDNDTTRECTFDIPAPAGTDTFYVTAFCSGCDDIGADLSAGLTTATIVSGTAQSISITLQPIIAASQSDIELGTPTPVGSANIGLSACPGYSCWLYDLDAGLGSGAAPVGDLEINLVDASGLPIPPEMPNPDPSALVNGVAPAINNTDPFVVKPNSDPALSLTDDTFSIGSITEVNGSGGHVYYGTDASCASSTTLSTSSWTNAYAFGLMQFPYVCYDNNASFNGDAEQYYATLSVATTGGTIATSVITPVFVPAPASSACGSLDAGEACQEIAQYGLGYVFVDVSACSSSYFSFTTDQGSVSGGNEQGLYGFSVDLHGYMEVAIDYTGSNDSDTCLVTYYTDDGAIVNRFYTAGTIDGYANSGGSTNGNIITVFGHKKRVH